MNDAATQAILRARAIESKRQDSDSDSDSDDEEEDGRTITLPTLLPPHSHMPKTTSIPPQRRHGDPESLFEKGGILDGKKLMRYPISKVSEKRGDSYEIYEDGGDVPLPRHHAREKLFQLALVHLLGFPDHSPGHLICGPDRSCYPDATYESMKLAFECDEEQHIDRCHPFNKMKPNYQEPRDKAVNDGYRKDGYYVVRVLACKGPVRVVPRDETPGWKRKQHKCTDQIYPISPLEVYKLTLRAVRSVLEEKKKDYAANDFSGKVVVIGADKEIEEFARKHYHVDQIEEKFQIFSEEEKMERRGTILAQELAMIDAERFLRRQERSRNQHIPSTAPSGLSIFAIGSKVKQNNSSSSSSGYEAKWRALLDRYDAEERYNERVARIDKDLARIVVI